MLEPTRLYPAAFEAVREFDVRAVAHITGGGLFENVPRVLPDGLAARFDRSAWSTPPIIEEIVGLGGVDPFEAHRVFNMGLGLVMVVPEKGGPDPGQAMAMFTGGGTKTDRKGKFEVGKVGPGNGQVILLDRKT